MIAENMPFPEYLALDRASFHTLWSLVNESPLHSRMRQDRPNVSMTLGTAFHGLLFEGKDPLIRPNPPRSNGERKTLIHWLENATRREALAPPESASTEMARLNFQIAEHEKILAEMDVSVCTQEQADTIRRMRDSAMAKRSVQLLLSAGKAEVTCLQRAEEHKLNTKCRWDWLPKNYEEWKFHTRIKCRWDWIPKHYTAILDGKTARSIAPRQFQSDAMKYGYFMQGAFYRWLYELEFGHRPAFFILAVENTEPYDSMLMEMSEDALRYGRDKFEQALEIYAKCKALDFWPGRDWDWEKEEHKIRTLDLPNWAKYD